MFGALGSGSSQAFTPLTIGADALAGWYIARANAAAAAAGGPQLSGASSGRFNQNSDVKAPWDPGATPSPSEELARRALATGVFVDTEDLEGYSDVDAPDDHKQLFALHQALKKLQAIASQSGDKAETDERRIFLDRRFQEGLDQVLSYVASSTFTGISLVSGEAKQAAESGVAIPRGQEVFRTGVLHEGDFDAEVAGFTGDRSFTLTVEKFSGDDIEIEIDLAEMGSTTRNLDNVADFINTKLEAAEVITRFKRVKVGEEDEDGIIPGSRFGFEVQGIESETLVFSAPASETAAVYLAGTSGRTRDDVVAAGQLTKLSGVDDAAPTLEHSVRLETAETDGEIDGLKVSATAAGPDGGVYVLGTTDAGTTSGPSLRGEQDVVLAKYDATGRQVWIRHLGVSDSAEGHTLAVGEDGSVTIAGSLKGALGETIDRGGSDAFVTRFDAAGAELWTQRFGGIGDESVDAVAVDADGVVYVAGRTKSPLAGTAHGGGMDGFVRALDTDGSTLWTRQFGDADDERATAVEIADDGGLLVASLEDGEGFLRKFSTVDGTSAAVWEHALGDLDEGSINAIHADDTGIYVTGAARSGMTLTDPVLAHSGARDAFVIAFDDGGAPNQRFATFLGTQSEDVAKDIAVLDGSIYIAGYTDGELPSGGELSGSRNTFAAKLDATSGALDWSKQITGRGGFSEGAGLAIDEGGASDLDAFGLPAGVLTYQDERTVAQRTTARAGDHLYLSINGGRKIKIEIDSDDTLRALAFKIDAELLLDGDAKVKRGSEGDLLDLRPKPGVTIELFEGGEGQDLLAALGMEPGAVRKPAEGEDADEVKSYGLDLSSLLKISDLSSAQSATSKIGEAMTTIRSAYRHLTRDPALDDLLNGTRNQGGAAPAYMLAKIANYQNALARLGG